MADLIQEDQGMVNITLRTIGPSPSSHLRVPSAIKTVIPYSSIETVTVASKPKPPAKHVRNSFDDDDGDEDLIFQLPESASRWKRRLFFMLRDKYKLPAILLWFVLAPFAHRLGIGPLYILGTGFLIVFYNLGRRQPGDLSAYSIFNEDFRELPGTLNADHIDRDMRHGRF